MSYQVFMSIWGGFALLMAAGLLLAWIQRTVRKSRQVDPSLPGAAAALRDGGVKRLSVRQFASVKGMEFTRGESEELGTGMEPGAAGSETGSAKLRWLVLEGRGRSPLFDYEIHREPLTPEGRQRLEEFARRFNAEN